MKVSQVDWSVVRGSLLVLLLGLALGAAAVAAGYTWEHDVAQRYAADQRRLAAVRGRYRSVDDERRLIERYLPAYRALVERGVVGGERRLAWIETLRRIAGRLKLPALRYEIAPQVPYTPEIDLNLGPFRVYESRMRLDLGLLHEGDLLRFLAAVQASAPGLLRVRRCDIKRHGAELILAPDAINLRAQCQLGWLTVRRPEEAS